jgi:Peptidase M15
MINLEDNITPNFKWKEALYLPTWGIYHTPRAEEIQNIINTANVMEKIRSFLDDKAINVHAWIRPTSVNCSTSTFNGKNYNLIVHGAQFSMHIPGCAVDFSVSTMTCDDVKYHLLSKLEEFNIRLENNGAGATWVHVDTKEVLPGQNRFFKP